MVQYTEFAVAVPMDGNPTIDHNLCETDFILLRTVLTEWGVPFKIITHILDREESGDVKAVKHILVKGRRD